MTRITLVEVVEHSHLVRKDRNPSVVAEHSYPWVEVEQTHPWVVVEHSHPVRKDSSPLVVVARSHPLVEVVHIHPWAEAAHIQTLVVVERMGCDDGEDQRQVVVERNQSCVDTDDGDEGGVDYTKVLDP